MAAPYCVVENDLAMRTRRAPIAGSFGLLDGSTDGSRFAMRPVRRADPMPRNRLERIPFQLESDFALVFCLSMFFSQNRFPLLALAKPGLRSGVARLRNMLQPL